MEYSKICYKNSCLSSVLIRLDFLEFVNNDIIFNHDVEKLMLTNFPKKEMQQQALFHTMNLLVDKDGTTTRREVKEGIQQEFKDLNGNSFTISNMYVTLQLRMYTTYENELSKLKPVLSKIMQSGNVIASRTGIRYVNLFDQSRIKPQKGFFNSQIGALFDSKLGCEDSVKPIRIMSLNEFVIDDMRLNFRYGHYNTRYPQVLNDKNFVLDYDCFCEDNLDEFDSVINHLEKGHYAIQKVFEASITDKLRKVMNDG